MKKCIKLSLILSAIVLTFMGCGFQYTKNVTLEAGGKVSLDLFLKDDYPDATLNPEAYEINTSIPGTHNVKIHNEDKDYEAVLEIKDTVAPTAVAASKTILSGQVLSADQFVTDIKDATAVNASFRDGVSSQTLAVGQNNVDIILRDAGNNETVITTQVTVLPVKYSIDLNLNDKVPTLNDFAAANDVKLSSTFNFGTINTKKYSLYPITINYSHNGASGTVESYVRIMEHDAPVINLYDPGVYVGMQLTPEMIVGKCEDASEVKLRFAQEPNTSELGFTDVTVIATDMFDNTTKESITLHVIKDEIAPLIWAPPVITGELNAAISYKKNITVVDNKDSADDIDISVDSSQVKIEAVGTYPVTFTATDTSGNSYSTSTTVEIVEPKTTELYKQVDAILANIIEPNSSKYDKAYQVYLYCRYNISYNSRESDKSSDEVGATDALNNRSGDCFNYYALAKIMFDRLGIPNMRVERYNPAITDHYWLLVDCGDGYMHLDPCPRGGSGVYRSFSGFMRIDSELDYFNKNNNSDPTYYQFDSGNSKYPKRATSNSMVDRNKYPS